MRVCVLDIQTMGNDLDFSGIQRLGEVTVYDLSKQEEVVQRIRDAEVLILNKVKLTKELLWYAKELKLICITATGYDNVDIDYCREHGIAVCNVVGYSTDSVVQLTVSMAFSLVTHLWSYDQYVKSGAYTQSGIFNRLTPVFREISALTWGVVGLGAIGSKVARIAGAMGCRVLAYKRTPVSEYNCVDLDTLCKESDIITVHVPLNEHTHHLIMEEQIAQMKPGVVLVNVARGAVCSEEAVAKAVLEGKIGGLGVDVYSVEPMQADNPYQKLLGHENVIFTPHMAWGAYDARQRCIYEVEENMKSFLSGGRRCRVV